MLRGNLCPNCACALTQSLEAWRGWAENAQTAEHHGNLRWRSIICSAFSLSAPIAGISQWSANGWDGPGKQVTVITGNRYAVHTSLFADSTLPYCTATAMPSSARRRGDGVLHRVCAFDRRSGFLFLDACLVASGGFPFHAPCPFPSRVPRGRPALAVHETRAEPGGGCPWRLSSARPKHVSDRPKRAGRTFFSSVREHGTGRTTCPADG